MHIRLLLKKKSPGFTLVELAIALVIIGLIVGAVMKGTDLMTQARAKQFSSRVTEWGLCALSFIDRKGCAFGDSNKNGRIDGGTADVKADLLSISLKSPPFGGATGSETNTFRIGSSTFYVFFGTDNGNDSGSNIMTICNSSDCSSDFSANEAVYAESFDTAIDNYADGTVGRVICSSSAPSASAPDTARWIASYAAGEIASISCHSSCNVSARLFDIPKTAYAGGGGGGGGGACSRALIYYYVAKS